MDSYDFVSCLKLIRVLRLGKLISYLNESEDFKLQLRLFKLIFFFLVYLHVTTCVWYIVNIIYDSEWVPIQWELMYQVHSTEHIRRTFYNEPWQH